MTILSKKTALLLASGALTLALVLPASAMAEKQKPGSGSISSAQEDVREAISDGSFTDEERQKIKDFYMHRKPDDGDDGDDDDDDDGDDDNGHSKMAGKDSQKSKGKSSSKDKGTSKGKSSSKGKSGDMPPGLAMKDELPPGLAMQLEKNGTLPPGLAKRDLPNDLNTLLPLRNGDYKRYLVEDDVILMDEKTGRILDIMRGVVASGLL